MADIRWDRESILSIFDNVISFILAAIGTSILYWHREFKYIWRHAKNISYHNDNFARETIKYRFKDILFKLNKSHEAEPGFEKLPSYSELTDSAFDIKFLSKPVFANNTAAKIMESWQNKLRAGKYAKMSQFFSKAPFIDVEHYFYFYILDRYGWGEKSQTDPYRKIKISSLVEDYSQGSKSKIKKLLDIALAIRDNHDDKARSDILADLLKENLSSNSTDLSQMFWEKFSDVSPIINDTEEFWKHYCSNMIYARKINIMADNFGVELFADIILGYFLIVKGGNSRIQVEYHTNKLPIFVSDVFEKDETLMMSVLTDLIKADPEGRQEYMDIIEEIKAMMESNKLLFSPDMVWNMPATYYDLLNTGDAGYKEKFDSLFRGTDLLIVKGDLNYRRLVGDMTYSPASGLKSKVKYIKNPLLVIRSFKSDVTLLGRKTYREIKNSDVDQDWQSNGRYGVIQYLN